MLGQARTCYVCCNQCYYWAINGMDWRPNSLSLRSLFEIEQLLPPPLVLFKLFRLMCKSWFKIYFPFCCLPQSGLFWSWYSPARPAVKGTVCLACDIYWRFISYGMIMPPTLVYYLMARFVAIYCREELLQLRLACSGNITLSHSFVSSARNLTSGSLCRKEFCIVFLEVSFCL